MQNFETISKSRSSREMLSDISQYMSLTENEIWVSLYASVCFSVTVEVQRDLVQYLDRIRSKSDTAAMSLYCNKFPRNPAFALGAVPCT